MAPRAHERTVTQLLAVFAASSRTLTADDVRGIAEDAWYGEADLAFGAGSGGSVLLTVHLPGGGRPVVVTIEADPAVVTVMVAEQLEEHDATPPDVARRLRATRQVVSFEVDLGPVDDDAWGLVDVVQAWLARELDGLVVTDDGIYDVDLRRLAD